MKRDLVWLCALVAVYAALGLGREMGLDEGRAEAAAAQRARAEEARSLSGQCAAIEAALRDVVRAQADTTRAELARTTEACAEVADTCAVPGWWMELEVVPVPRLAAREGRR